MEGNLTPNPNDVALYWESVLHGPLKPDPVDNYKRLLYDCGEVFSLGLITPREFDDIVRRLEEQKNEAEVKIEELQKLGSVAVATANILTRVGNVTYANFIEHAIVTPNRS